MGLETAAAVTAGTGIYNAFQQDKTNKAAVGADNQYRQQMLSQGQSLMNTGLNDFASQISDFLKTLNPNAPGITSPTINPTSIDMSSISPNLNLGNDAIMQAITKAGQNQLDPTANAFLKSTVSNGGNPFDTSNMFKSLAVTDKQGIDQQVNDLIAQSQGGGLGQRFGTSVASKSSNLRQNLLDQINTRNAGIQSSSYEAGQGRAMGAAQELDSGTQQLLNLAISGGTALNSGALASAGLNLQGATTNVNAANSAATANAGNTLTADQLNQQKQQALIQSILSGITSAGGLQQGQNSLNAQIYQAMFGAGAPATAPASGVPNALSTGLQGMSQAQLLQTLLANQGRNS